MFKRVLIALSIVLAFSGPVVAKDQREWENLAARAGCPVSVQLHVRPNIDGFNAAYAYEDEVLHFLNFDTIPESWQLFIFYHEVGHCLQFRSGRIKQLQESDNVNAVEWDADEYSIDKLAELRLDGAAIQAEALAEFYRLRGGDFSDDAHGAYTHRIQNGMLKRSYRQVES